MTQFVEVPAQRVQADVLVALLEEYASRDGTDYGERELTLEQKTLSLREQIKRGELVIICELDSEHWDLLPADNARTLLRD